MTLTYEPPSRAPVLSGRAPSHPLSQPEGHDVTHRPSGTAESRVGPAAMPAHSLCSPASLKAPTYSVHRMTVPFGASNSHPGPAGMAPLFGGAAEFVLPPQAATQAIVTKPPKRSHIAAGYSRKKLSARENTLH